MSVYRGAAMALFRRGSVEIPLYPLRRYYYCDQGAALCGPNRARAVVVRSSPGLLGGGEYRMDVL